MTEVLRSAADAGRRSALPRLRLGWSEGDTWTVGIGLALAISLAVSTIPAVLDAREAVPRAAAPAAEAPPAPMDAGAPVAPPEQAVALPPGELVAQPLLGPFVPPAPGPLTGQDPAPAPASAPVIQPTAPPLARGEVRPFAALPAQSAPGAVAAAPDGRVWAGTDAPGDDAGPSELLAWDAAGRRTGTEDVPDQPTDRTRGITAMSPLPDGALAVVDASTARLLRYDVGRRSWSTLAEVPDVAPCLGVASPPCQPGVLDRPPLLRGVTVDADGAVYLADAGQGTIWRLPAGQPLESWWSSAGVMGDEGLAGMAIGGDGHLRVVVTRLTDLQGAGAGALLRVDREDDGSAGARTVVSAFRAEEDPVDVALGSSGNAYVALRGADAVVTLDSSGVEQLRVVDDALRGPTAVHLEAGRVLVTTTAPTPAVLEAGVDDKPIVPAPPTAGGSVRG